MEDASRNSVLCQVQAVQMSDQDIVWTGILEGKETLKLPIIAFFFNFFFYLNPGEKDRDKQQRKGIKEKGLAEFPLCIRERIWKTI